MASSIYDFTVKDQQGNDVSLADYRGRVLLVVNTATECGFTPTYAQLEALYTTLHERGLDILDFPCDQFGHQAPGTNEEIARFCTSRFGVTFPQFAKIEVNGEGADPLFAYLQQQKGFEGFDEGHELTPVLEDLLAKDDPDYAGKPDIKWNFTKFLIDREGNVVRRFHPRCRGARRGGAAVAFSVRTHLAQAHEARTREPANPRTRPPHPSRCGGLFHA